MAEVEYFISTESTQYKWERSKEVFIRLTDDEVERLKSTVSQMSDKTIQNRESGNGIVMGIPIYLEHHRLLEVNNSIINFINDESNVKVSKHALSRIIGDSLLDENDPKKRGWLDEDEVRESVFRIKKVLGIRLNVNHFHPHNTDQLKHMHQDIAIVIEVKKDESSNGKLAIYILNGTTLSIITVL